MGDPLVRNVIAKEMQFSQAIIVVVRQEISQSLHTEVAKGIEIETPVGESLVTGQCLAEVGHGPVIETRALKVKTLETIAVHQSLTEQFGNGIGNVGVI